MKKTNLKIISIFLLIILGISFGNGFIPKASADGTYGVYVTLSGLDSGKTVILQNNGGDNLTLTADGSFNFATLLNDQDGYLVTVYTQPVGQACSVTNGSGTVEDSNVMDIQVDCHHTPTTTATPAGGSYPDTQNVSLNCTPAAANVAKGWTAHGTSQNWEDIAMSSDGTIQTAVVWGGRIYASADSGVTWTPRDSSRYWKSIAMSGDGTIQTALVGGIYKGGGSDYDKSGQIYTSTDSGATWTPRDSSRKWQSVAMSNDGTKQTAVAWGGQIYTSTDSGATWTPRDSERNWQGVAMSSNGTIQTAVAYGGQIYTSSNSGVTWTTRDSDRNWQSVAMSSNGIKQTAVEYLGQIYTSTDSGATWTARSTTAVWIGVAMSSDGTIQTAVSEFQFGAFNYIYTSTNSGVTWTGGDGTGIYWYGIAMSSDGMIQARINNYIYISNNSCDKTYYTTNGDTPTTDSAEYSSPIHITGTTTLKFFSTDNLGNSESANTESYTISGNSIPSSPTGLVVY